MGRGAAWTNTDDYALCRAWVASYENADVPRAILFDKIQEQLAQDEDMFIRTQKAIVSRWKRISSILMEFGEMIQEIEDADENDTNMVETCFELYEMENPEKAAAIDIPGCWKIVSASPKWQIGNSKSKRMFIEQEEEIPSKPKSALALYIESAEEEQEQVAVIQKQTTRSKRAAVGGKPPIKKQKTPATPVEFGTPTKSWRKPTTRQSIAASSTVATSPVARSESPTATPTKKLSSPRHQNDSPNPKSRHQSRSRLITLAERKVSILEQKVRIEQAKYDFELMMQAPNSSESIEYFGLMRKERLRALKQAHAMESHPSLRYPLLKNDLSIEQLANDSESEYDDDAPILYTKI